MILESFRPGVAERLGIGPDAAPARAVYCSLTGFGLGGAHEQRAGHDLNYVGWAGLLEDTAPALPPVQAADLAAGALGVVTEVLAALLVRERTGRGAHVVVSMTHGAQRLTPGSPVLTHGFACYSIYACADGRQLTVAALEPKFFQRLCELVGRPELAERQYDAHQSDLKNALAKVFSTRPLAEWLRLFDGEDVCVGRLRRGPKPPPSSARPPVTTRPQPASTRRTGSWNSACDRSVRRGRGDPTGTARCPDARDRGRRPRFGDAGRSAQETDRGAQDGAYSPDGTLVAFARNGDLWVANADGSGQRRLAATPNVDEWGPSWLPSGTAIVYTASVAGARQIRIVQLPTGPSRRIAASNAEEYGAAVSRTGKLAFVSTRSGVR